MFPVFLDLEGRLAVVVGGGPVGLRKARNLLEAGAWVRLVCREERPADLTHPRLEWLREPYRAAHLEGAALVFAAATPPVNQLVIRDARALRIWVNAAHDPGAGDFYVPSVVRRGDFHVAVGTGGAAPGLARAVRLRLEEEFDDAFGEWVALLAELRQVARAAIPDPARRGAFLRRVCGWEGLERLRREGAGALRDALYTEVRNLAEPPCEP